MLIDCVNDVKNNKKFQWCCWICGVRVAGISSIILFHSFIFPLLYCFCIVPLCLPLVDYKELTIGSITEGLRLMLSLLICSACWFSLLVQFVGSACWLFFCNGEIEIRSLPLFDPVPILVFSKFRNLTLVLIL